MKSVIFCVFFREAISPGPYMDNTLIRILIIEPEKRYSDVLRETLECSELSVAIFVRNTLAETLEQLRQNGVDIILLNPVLDSPSPLQVWTTLSKVAKDTPVILILNDTTDTTPEQTLIRNSAAVLTRQEITAAVLRLAIPAVLKQRDMHRQLQQQRDVYERSLTASGMWIHAVDHNGNITLWSRGAEAISGYSSIDILYSLHFWEAAFPDTAERELQFSRLLSLFDTDTEAEPYELRILAADGYERLLYWNASRLMDAQGEVTGLLIFGYDESRFAASESARIRSENRLHILAKLTSDYAYSAHIDTNGDMTTEWVVGAFECISGYSPDDVIGTPNKWLDIIHPDDLRSLNRLQEEAQPGAPLTAEYRILRKDGRLAWIRDSMQTITQDGRLSSVVGSVHDITLARQGEIDRRNLIKTQQSMINASSDSAMLLEVDGVIRMINAHGAARLGSSVSKLVGRKLPDLVPEDVAHSFQSSIETAIRAGITQHTEYVSDDRHFDVRITPVFNEAGTVNEVAVFAQDSTEKKLAAMHIAAEREKLRGIILNSTDGITLIAGNGQLLEWSPAMHRITGIPETDALGRKVWDIFDMLKPTDNDGTPLHAVQRTMITDILQSRGEQWLGRKHTQWIHRHDGTRRYIETVVFPVQSSQGLLAASINRDITDIKLVELDLQRKTDELQALLGVIPDIVYFKDRQGRYQIFNKALCDVLGQQAEKVRGHTDAELFPWEFAERITAVDVGILGSGVSAHVEDFLDNGNGERRYFDTIKVPLCDNDGSIIGLVGISRDITEQKQSIQALQESERIHRELIAAFPDMLFMFDELGRIIEYHAEEERQALLISAGVHGKTLEQLLPGGIGDRLHQAVQRFRDGSGNAHVEFSLGRPYIERTAIFEGRLRLVNNTVLALVRDITVEKENRRMLEKHNIILSERNQELDTFTHSVAHDLKNPLSLIIGYAELINEEREQLSAEELQQFSESILFNARKMINIINALLLLASVRKEDITPIPVDMHTIVQDALRRLNKIISDRGANITLPDTWPPIKGYAPWIEEVWANYISNAVKYGGDPCFVRIGSDDLGTSIRYWIHDNGAGIPEERREEVFRPFTRFSELDIEGHGLGLSIVGRIVAKLGGSVDVHMPESGGCVFSFTLPKA
jgi:PAS domain S-box-containing protein